MNEIFNKEMELSGLITKMAGACDVISIEVNAAMECFGKLDDGPKKNALLAERYLELAEYLAKVGIIKKEWGSE